MAYSEKAIQMRRCTARTKAGEQCKAWAIWGDPRRLCASHAGIKKKPYGTSPHRYRNRKSKARCVCRAYSFPHRPGGGLCRYPDEPIYICRTPAGTHAYPRIRRPKWFKRVFG
jgi:hypothetical protein